MPTDEIVAQVRKAREEYAEKFNYDMEKVIQDLKMRETKGGQQVVTLPAKLLKASSRNLSTS
jgi:polyhydroxyalkanoate synthesis regulator phasin